MSSVFFVKSTEHRNTKLKYMEEGGRYSTYFTYILKIWIISKSITLVYANKGQPCEKSCWEDVDDDETYLAKNIKKSTI